MRDRESHAEDGVEGGVVSGRVGDAEFAGLEEF